MQIHVLRGGTRSHAICRLLCSGQIRHYIAGLLDARADVLRRHTYQVRAMHDPVRTWAAGLLIVFAHQNYRGATPTAFPQARRAGITPVKAGLPNNERRPQDTVAAQQRTPKPGVRVGLHEGLSRRGTSADFSLERGVVEGIVMHGG